MSYHVVCPVCDVPLRSRTGWFLHRKTEHPDLIGQRGRNAAWSAADRRHYTPPRAAQIRALRKQFIWEGWVHGTDSDACRALAQQIRALVQR